MKKALLLLSVASISMGAYAQKLAEGYITWPEAGDLATYVNAWNGGTGSLTINSKTWEDEEFFTSRVKPKTRFTNTATQVTTFANSKRHIWWVPIGDAPSNGLRSNALPNASLDTEVFSMWSYLDHFGDWTSPYGWVPAAFADAAHKNGVAASGVAQPAYGQISTGWTNSFNAITSVNASALGKFLVYHGVDGLGYNSEWSGYSPTKLITMHDNLKTYMADKNPIWEVIWYAGTNDNGSLAFDKGMANNTKLFAGASIFLNYNWNSASYLSSAATTANNTGKSSAFVYAGCNQQGGEPSSYADAYKNLKNSSVSLGYWGAHNYNMLWQSRNSNGSSEEAMQRTYLNSTEQWFGNGVRNPAIKLELKDNKGHRPSDDWAGISALLAARSVYSWDTKTESFITYFNLGNGKFFNINGERVSDNPWYNIGIQDYLPTWRWWFADSYLNKDVNAANVHLAADFTWDDAYFGGSCLRIHGSSDDEFLHLFKTNFTINNNDWITIRYKILDGEADIDLALSLTGHETTLLDLDNSKLETSVLTLNECDAAKDQSFRKGADGWCVKQIRIPAAVNKKLTEVYKETNETTFALAQIGLRFRNAKNLDILLGEMSLRAGGAKNPSNLATPAPPVVKKTTILKSGNNVVDGKFYWSMTNQKAAGEPVYNSDVNTGYFKVYAQEEGSDYQFLCATTSWAAVCLAGPNTDPAKKIRYGVSAVSTDFQTESAIAWGDYTAKGSYEASDKFQISKNVIKPGESFAISFVDKFHPAASWSVSDDNGKVYGTANGTSIEIPAGLPSVGRYNVTINGSTLYGYIPVSDEDKGALPEIYTIEQNGEDLAAVEEVKIDITDDVQLSYTGREADGVASRGIALASGIIGVKVGDLGLQARQSFTVAGWYRFAEFPALEWDFINVANKGGSWPINTWGWSWNYATPDGKIFCTFRGSSDGTEPGELHYEFPNTTLQAGVWVHIAQVNEYNSTGFRSFLYINGIKQESKWFQYTKGGSGSIKTKDQSTDTWCVGQTYGVQTTDILYFGGPKYQGAAVDGEVDDWQIWGKALSEEEVKNVMKGLPSGQKPDGLLVRYEFEQDADADYTHPSTGTLDVRCSNYEWATGEGEGQGSYRVNRVPAFVVGCPFIDGTAYDVTTKATWDDNFRRTEFTKVNATRATTTEGASGKVNVAFNEIGDHTVSLTLANAYGSESVEFPVFMVSENLAAIGDIDVDNQAVTAEAVNNTLFVKFAQDGDYTIEVYNVAGMLAGKKAANVLAGQHAAITLGAKGVYLVKVTRDGRTLRTIKVANN